MEEYFFHLFFDDDFRYYSFETQALFLKEKSGMSVCGQTLNNYKTKLINHYFIREDKKDVRYYACNSGQIPKKSTEKEHRKAWKRYGKTKLEAGEEEARAEMKAFHGGIINRRYGFEENGIYKSLLDELRQILKSKQEQE